MDAGGYDLAGATQDDDDDFTEHASDYRAKIGKLMYLQSKTRPDVSFASCLWARYMQNPCGRHSKGLKRVSST
jgi:hypothetical protein